MNENNIKVLFPEGVETITISKNDYDRLFGQLTYENIVLQSKIDKTIEYVNNKDNWKIDLNNISITKEENIYINKKELENILKEDK